MPFTEDIFAFTDRPNREHKYISAEEFVSYWSQDATNSFQFDPPNAVLTSVDDDGVAEVEVVIINASTDGDNITYTIQSPKLTENATFEDVSLFVDGNADDPLLFAPIGNGYYYLIHKWGNDLSPYRKLAVLPFKSFENLMILTAVVSFFASFLVPKGLLSIETSGVQFLLTFLFMFKSVAAVVLHYSFAAGKNFNSVIWDSKYSNA